MENEVDRIRTLENKLYEAAKYIGIKIGIGHVSRDNVLILNEREVSELMKILQIRNDY